MLFKLPVLTTNWLVLRASGLGTSSSSSSGSDGDDAARLEARENRYDQRVGGLVLVVSVAVLLASLLYFATVDQRQLCGEQRSAAALVNRTSLHMEAAAAQSAVDRGDSSAKGLDRDQPGSSSSSSSSSGQMQACVAHNRSTAEAGSPVGTLDVL